MHHSSDLTDSRVLVTGATGFIGSRLAERLAEEGAAVTAIGRKLERVEGLRAKGVELVAVDLTDTAAVRDVVRDKDIIFHSAAIMSTDARLAEAVNVTATEALARLAAGAGVRRFVHVSTVAVYAIDSEGAVPESTPLAVDHSSTYSRTKARSEQRVFAVGRETGMEVTAARPSQVYGPGHGVWTVGMVNRICDGQPVLVGDGMGNIFPVYLDDVVEALLLCATSPEGPGEAFNVSAPATTWHDFMSRYGDLCGKQPKSMPLLLARLLAAANRIPGITLPIDKGFIEMATSRNHFPIDKARQLLGWEPRTPLDEGMRQTVQWLRDQGLVPADAPGAPPAT